jgi:hypothetical protein
MSRTSQPSTNPVKFAEPRPFSDPEAAVRKLIEIANAAEAVQDARTDAGAGLMATTGWKRHFRGSGISPPTLAQHFPFDRTRLLLFQPVALCAKPIDFVQHPIQQRCGRSRWNACSLELPNLAALAVDLNAHTLDLGPNAIDIRHGSAL